MELNRSSLTTIRKLSGLSQAELARRSRVSQGHISGIEAGDKKASPKTIVALAEAMGVPVAALITSLSDDDLATAANL